MKCFLRHGSGGDWGSCSAVWVEKDAYHVEKHSRPTPRLAHVITGSRGVSCE